MNALERVVTRRRRKPKRTYANQRSVSVSGATYFKLKAKVRVRQISTAVEQLLNEWLDKQEAQS